MKLREKDNRVAKDFKVGDVVRKRTQGDLGIVLSTQLSQVTSQSQVLSSKLTVLWGHSVFALELQAWKFTNGATRGNPEGFRVSEEYPVGVEVVDHQPDWLLPPTTDKELGNRLTRIMENE